MPRIGRVCAGPVLLLLAALGCSVQALIPRDVVIVVLLSPGGSHYEAQAHQLRDDVHNQARLQGEEAPAVHLSNEFPHPGAWTVLPILKRLETLHGSNSSWIFFCESHTKINLTRVLKYLGQYDPSEERWIGHALYDRQASIIHHFAFVENPQGFKYPNFASGFAMSRALLQRLVVRLSKDELSRPEFSIDPSHELALFVWNNDQGPVLKHTHVLCLIQKPYCASYPQIFQPCNKSVSKESIYFAVKTCERFHKERIPVVKETWAKYAVNIGFYSEVADESIPTIDLGIPNTENGHCGKTFAILKHVLSQAKSMPHMRWVVIADDDTILSVARLQQLLSCFNSSQPVALGERYGYNVQRSDHGYNYITGGGGMVLSIDLVSKIVSSKHCKCPSNSTPDDMFLGICLVRMGVPITHSPFFHQARPLDYAPEYLFTQVPVSFHKHWMINPVEVYNKWFAAVDQESEAGQNSHKHLEL